MDELFDLDEELARLRQELNIGDTSRRAANTPSSGDYWRRRHEEDRSLWQQRMTAHEEEKKALTEKIVQQKTLLDAYQAKLEGFERRIENESRGWEERFRAKEADLVLEKNRLLWEERLREAKTENHALLDKVNTLNERITEIKDEHDQERQQHEIYEKKEKAVLEEKATAVENQMEVLKGRIVELEHELKMTTEELHKQKQGYEERIAESELSKNTAIQQKDKAVTEYQQQQKHNEQIIEQLQQENQKITIKHNDIVHDMVKTVQEMVAPIAGLIDGLKNGVCDYQSWGEASALLDNIPARVMEISGIHPQHDALKPNIVIIGDEQERTTLVTQTSSQFTVHQWSGGELAEIEKMRPRVIVVCNTHRKETKKITKRWPFLPIMMYGIESRRWLSFARHHDISVVPAGKYEELVNRIETAAQKSPALYPYWESLIPVRHISYLWRALVVLTVAGVVAVGGYGVVKYTQRVRPFPPSLMVDVPYAKPSSISYDGNAFWVSDWYGQNIYRHTANRTFGLEKIFHFPERHISAVSWGGGHMWSIDPWEKTISKHTTNDRLDVLSTYKAPGSTPSGIAYGAGVLWSCDAETKKIYRHALDDTLSVEIALDAPGPSPAGVFWDGQRLWSIDSELNRIYMHGNDALMSVQRAYVPPDYEQKGFMVSGITVANNGVWVCAERAGQIVRYEISALKMIR